MALRSPHIKHVEKHTLHCLFTHHIINGKGLPIQSMQKAFAKWSNIHDNDMNNRQISELQLEVPSDYTQIEYKYRNTLSESKLSFFELF